MVIWLSSEIVNCISHDYQNVWRIENSLINIIFTCWKLGNRYSLSMTQINRRLYTWPVFYLLAWKVMVDEGRRYTCNISSHRLRPCSAINGNWPYVMNKWTLWSYWYVKTVMVWMPTEQEVALTCSKDGKAPRCIKYAEPFNISWISYVRLTTLSFRFNNFDGVLFVVSFIWALKIIWMMAWRKQLGYYLNSELCDSEFFLSKFGFTHVCYVHYILNLIVCKYIYIYIYINSLEGTEAMNFVSTYQRT